MPVSGRRSLSGVVAIPSRLSGSSAGSREPLGRQGGIPLPLEDAARHRLAGARSPREPVRTVAAGEDESVDLLHGTMHGQSVSRDRADAGTRLGDGEAGDRGNELDRAAADRADGEAAVAVRLPQRGRERSAEHEPTGGVLADLGRDEGRSSPVVRDIGDSRRR
jgi:hypothetical protein